MEQEVFPDFTAPSAASYCVNYAVKMLDEFRPSVTLFFRSLLVNRTKTIYLIVHKDWGRAIEQIKCRAANSWHNLIVKGIYINCTLLYCCPFSSQLTEVKKVRHLPGLAMLMSNLWTIMR